MKKKAKILIVDDNEEILVALRLQLSGYFETVVTEKKPDMIPGLMSKESFDIIILDMNFKAGINTGNEGIYWMNKILAVDPAVSVIFITAYAGIELAVKAIQQGAADFIEKPWDDDKLLAAVLRAWELHRSKLEINSLRQKQKHLSEKIDHQYDFFMGSSQAMESVFRTIDKVASTDASVLILGENGTGKEVIAREIHKRSARSREVFISVDLGSLSSTLFESELFGHIKGAFTDAREDRPGRFEIASGGTLFLDEIGNLSSSLQSKLLTTLQSRKVTRIGSNRPIAVDIRLISATNRPVYELADQGEFREDLLYRINTIQLEIPPLRERQEDIPLLMNFFLEKYASKYGKPVPKTDKGAMDKLMQYNWPGNVRELQHMAEKAVILGEGKLLHVEDFFSGARARFKESLTDILDLETLEKEAIRKAIDRYRGNITRAVKDLGISRRALYYKLRKYDI
ncbi:MAG: sigma-54-dependent Fis family transcriptional regulator [Bacteroidales bacterium]|nr:sigma-54-dependent Fis family transcriptional regulator [Bacteroidales bacterium]